MSIRESAAAAIAFALLLAAPTQAVPVSPVATSVPAPAHKLTARPGRIFHLNCGTMQPPSALLVNGQGGLLGPGRLVAHCLLIETNQGLVLVDTGLGTADVTQPDRRFSWGFLALVRPMLAIEETARRQIERLGFRAQDVKDIVLTHVDADHVGGLADFPGARVHLTAREHQRVRSGSDALSPMRWAHGPKWVPHALAKKTWYGFDSVPLRPGMLPEIRLVGLPGHSAGHGGVAVREGERWLLHAGDAYYDRGEVAGATRRCPPALDAMHHLHGGVEFDAFAATQAALRRLARAPGSPVRMMSAHDPGEWIAFSDEGILPLLAATGR
jgi:glyoxylase-like metal-dependent hydrolase (beta-lactamase superfamily II)